MSPLSAQDPAQDPRPHGVAALGWLLSLFITTAALLAAALPAAAAERTGPRAGRLTVTVEVEREASTRNGADHARHKSSAFVQFATTLQSDGELTSFNPLDPAEATRQMERAAQVQKRLQQVQAQQAQQAQQSQRPAAAGPTQAEMMARVQQMQVLCGADRDCLAREAMKLSAANSGLGAGGQQQLQAYGAAYRACEKRHPEGAARRGCIDNARRQAGGQPDATDHDDEPPPRYQHFIGGLDGANCNIATRVRLTERSEGASADVQGMVPFVITRQAEGSPAAPLLCAGSQLVLDTRTGEIWNQAGHGFGEVRGVRVFTSGGRTQRTEEGMDLGWYEAGPWIGEQLRRFPRQGELHQVLPVAGGTGQVKVRLQWRFEPQ